MECTNEISESPQLQISEGGSIERTVDRKNDLDETPVYHSESSHDGVAVSAGRDERNRLIKHMCHQILSEPTLSHLFELSQQNPAHADDLTHRLYLMYPRSMEINNLMQRLDRNMVREKRKRAARGAMQLQPPPPGVSRHSPYPRFGGLRLPSKDKMQRRTTAQVHIIDGLQSQLDLNLGYQDSEGQGSASVDAASGEEVMKVELGFRLKK